MRELLNRCGKACRREIRHVCYLGLVLILLFGSDATAQNDLKPESITDPVFLFRAAMSGMLGILIWVARKADKRLENLETIEREQLAQRAKGYGRLEVVESKLQLMEHEQRQMLSLISMQREVMLTDYVKKSEIERHLNKQDLVLDNISRRLDMATDRNERRRDDKRDDNG